MTPIEGRKAEVYNISVGEIPEYFANGILVHNCRYGLHAIREEQNVVPRELVVANAVAALGDGASGHSRYMTAVHVEKKCAQSIGMKIGTLPRNVGRHRRSMVSMRTP